MTELPLGKSDAIARPPKAKATPNQTLAIVCVGICLANLDLFIVNVALPDIAIDFGHASLENMSWVLNGYAIIYAALLVFFGRLAERYRRNMSFLLGVGLFTAASAACAMATGVTSLVLFRLLQAAGAALMTPTSIGLLLAVFPPEQRGAAVRTWTAIGGLAAALGPVAGGLLLTLNWRWIFLVNVPVGLLALVVGWRKLPDVPGHDVKLPNLYAAALVTLGIASLTLAIVKATDWGWGSLGVLGSLGAAAVLIGLFVFHCALAENPFIDPSIFRSHQFTGASLVMAPYSVAFGAMLFSIGLWEQSAWHWSALQAGLTISPGPLMVPITSLLFAGKLIKRFGPAAVVTVGTLLFAIGVTIWATALDLTPQPLPVVVGMMAIGIGVGLTYPTVMGVGTSALPPSSFATGSAVINMIRQAALAIGVAMFIAVAGTAASPAELLTSFRSGWWLTAFTVLLSLIPTFTLIRHKQTS